MTDHELDARFETLLATLLADVSAEIKADGLATRRHIDVIVESIKAELSVVCNDIRRSATAPPPRSRT